MAFYGLGIISDAVFGRAVVEFMTIALLLVQIPSKKVHVGPRTCSQQVQVPLRMVVEASGGPHGRAHSIFWLQKPCSQIL